MKRRSFLSAAGAATVCGLTGCLSDYPTQSYEGADVPLVSTGEAYEWYENDEARFVDARSAAEYEAHRIEGAVHSKYPDGNGEDDPVAEWPTDQRIVTYCVCPHAQAVARAGTLINEGYEEVYALDDGLRDWEEKGHPMAGSRYGQELPTYTVSGRVDEQYAGEEVWIREPEYGQSEVGNVQDDGSYEIQFHFVDVDEDTIIEVETPEETFQAPFGELQDEGVAGGESADGE